MKTKEAFEIVLKLAKAKSAYKFGDAEQEAQYKREQEAVQTVQLWLDFIEGNKNIRED